MPIITDPLASLRIAIVLDPSEVADAGRVELDLNQDEIRVAEAGPDWGDAAIEQYLAEAARGQLPVDFRIPNRQIQIPLTLGIPSEAGIDTARIRLQAKVALIQREGGWIKRATGVYADLVSASLRLPDRYGDTFGFETDVVLTLEAIPDFYGDEETLADHVETTATELIFTHTDIKGDYPGRARIRVDDDQGQARLGLIWGIRARHYSVATTAALAYEAELLTPASDATIATLSGASGGASNNVVRHSSLGSGWTPVLGTDLAGVGALTHAGTYRVWARVYTPTDTSQDSGPPTVRLVWDVGDLVNPEENDPVEIPLPFHLYNIDLGEIRLTPAPVGTHRWRGQIQGKGRGGEVDTLDIDKVWFVPVDDGYGVAQSSLVTTEGLVVHSARDEFRQSSGNLAGKTASVGGTWAGAGVATDFTVDDTTHVAKRTATSDTGLRLERLGAALTDTAVRADFRFSAAADGFVSLGLLARYVDANNYLTVTLTTPVNGISYLHLEKRVAGSSTEIARNPPTWSTTPGSALPGLKSTNAWYSMLLMVDAAGHVSVFATARGSGFSEPLLVAEDSSLATGGALASGRAGLVDSNTSATACERSYDSFAAWVPTGDPVINANRTVELRHDGVFREAVDGGSYGPASPPIGTLPRLPPAGLEDRTVQVFLKASRGDFGRFADTGVDDTSARVYYRPSWLFPVVGV